MEFTPKGAKRRRIIDPELSALQEQYPHDLQLYKIPPAGQISLTEFEDLALERQKVLQLLELTLAQQHKTFEELKTAFTNSLKKEGYHDYARLLNALGCASHERKDVDARRKDHISHFIIRLAYSLKDDLQQKMLVHETELFKLRFSSLNKEGITQFLAISGLQYSPISQEFKEQNRENLYAGTAKDTSDFENIEFYELPFDEVVNLVADRKVYVHKGIAYVPQYDLSAVFVNHFRSNLSMELNRARRFIVRNLDDERLQAFLKSLPECFAEMTKVIWNTEHVPINKLNDLSKTSYPLCMRIMHEHLMTNHHLKNTGRLQYGLFLKGINVTVEDSIEFWRSELTKKEGINDDVFEKKYLYHIQYNYGKVGRRVSYNPHACNKLITDAAGPGDVHGCPYKHMDIDELTKKLSEYKLNPTDIGEITRLANDGHYNLACNHYFTSTHKQPPEKMYLHPCQYFMESRKILTKGDDAKEENATQDMHTQLSPEKISQAIKVKVDNNLNTSNSVTPSRTTEKKVKTVDKKMENMNPLNIEAMLHDDSD